VQKLNNRSIGSASPKIGNKFWGTGWISWWLSRDL